MNLPSKSSMYLLAACVIAISLLFIAQKQITQKGTVVNLATVTSTTSNETINTSGYSNEELGLPEPTTASTGEIPDEPTTVTNSFAKDFFSKYAQSQSGGALDTNTRDSLINSTINQYSSETSISNHYSVADITTISSLDKEKGKAYVNAFVTMEDIGVREAQALSQNVDTDINNLMFVGERYKKLAENLRLLAVPDALLVTHIGIMNNYYRLGESLSKIPTSQEDPVKIIFLLKELKESQGERALYYNQISAFVKINGIIFTKDEPGYVFNPL